MKRFASQGRRGTGFTLIELVVAMTVVVVMAIVFAAMIGQMNLAWVGGQERVQNFQNGRAILEIMSRELAPAAISQSLQLVQNPSTAGASTSQPFLTTLLPSGSPATTQVANSDSLFWQQPSTANAYGNIYETGYFLTITPASTTTAAKYELDRLSIAPNSIATPLTTLSNHGANNSIYWIYDPPTAYSTVFPATTPWPEYSDAPWLTQLSATQFQSAISVVSEGVIALWIRCLDKNGAPIPWLYESSLYSSATPPVTTLKFNSAASFNPAILGSSSPSFAYTAPPSSIYGKVGTGVTITGPSTSATRAANRLPTAVQITIVTLDSQTLARNPKIPALPAPLLPNPEQNVPAQIQTYMATLVTNNIKSAKAFTTTVRLLNGTD